MTASERLCPCCKGSKGRWQHFDVPDAPDSWDHADGVECECFPEWEECLCCEGSGEVVGLRARDLGTALLRIVDADDRVSASNKAKTAWAPRAKITVTVKVRDWRWLWLRKKPVEVELFRGRIEEWE